MGNENMLIPDSMGVYSGVVTLAIRAIYEKGILRPLEPLDLVESTVVQISVETEGDDSERQQWLKQGQRTLMGVWDNEADDVYNVLLKE